MRDKIQVTIWNEYRHEKTDDEVKKVYPNGIHNAIGDYLKEVGDFEVKSVTLDDEEHGLTDEVLNQTDVLFWWGHVAHDEVGDDIVDRVYNRVLNGMGLIVLHSGHHAKIFKKLMGTTCNLKWREVGEKERLWVADPGHMIVEGIGEYIELPQEEMYGEVFEIPQPDELVFISWFEGGEVCRSGCCYKRGRGKVFYFRPGHESYPTFYNPDIQKVLANSARWAAPVQRGVERSANAPYTEPLEEIKSKNK